MQNTHETLGSLAERILHAVNYDKPVDLDDFRAWLHAAQEHEMSAPAILLQQWGSLVKRLLEKSNTKHIMADDGRFVASYLRAIGRTSSAQLTTNQIPGGQKYKNGYGRGYSTGSWDSRPLYQNTKDIFTLLSTVRCRPVTVNLFSVQQWDVGNALKLLKACDEEVDPRPMSLSRYPDTSQGLLLACVPDVLAHSAWCPASQDVPLYANAWYFAVRQETSREGSVQNVARLRACQEKLPHSPEKVLGCLLRNPTMPRDEVHAVFPLEVERLGTVVGLQWLMHVHVHRNKALGWGYVADLFKEHHSAFAGLVETHLVLYPNGKPVEHLLEPWALLVAGKEVQPQEELSVSELVS